MIAGTAAGALLAASKAAALTTIAATQAASAAVASTVGLGAMAAGGGVTAAGLSAAGATAAGATSAGAAGAGAVGAGAAGAGAAGAGAAGASVTGAGAAGAGVAGAGAGGATAGAAATNAATFAGTVQKGLAVASAISGVAGGISQSEAQRKASKIQNKQIEERGRQEAIASQQRLLGVLSSNIAGAAARGVTGGGSLAALTSASQRQGALDSANIASNTRLGGDRTKAFAKSARARGATRAGSSLFNAARILQGGA